jgi:hypothetical protein
MFTVIVLSSADAGNIIADDTNANADVTDAAFLKNPIFSPFSQDRFISAADFAAVSIYYY